MKLTIANYYTPKGNNINKIGIKPDIEVSLDNSLLNKTRDEITHEEDNQLQKRLRQLRRKSSCLVDSLMLYCIYLYLYGQKLKNIRKREATT